MCSCAVYKRDLVAIDPVKNFFYLDIIIITDVIAFDIDVCLYISNLGVNLSTPFYKMQQLSYM